MKLEQRCNATVAMLVATLLVHVEATAQQATGSYRRALRLRPRDERTHYDLGLALLSMGEREAAELVRDALQRLGSELAATLDEHLARLEDD